MAATLDVERHGHVNLYVQDYDRVVSGYRDLFGAEVFMGLDEKEHGGRNALWLVGGTCFEAFTPTDQDLLIGHWLAKYGSGWHSVEWTIPDLDEALEIVKRRNLRVTDYRAGAYLFTHPRDLHGLTLELTAVRFAGDKRDNPGWTPAYWREQHPLGITGNVVVKLASYEPEKAATDVAQLTGRDISPTEDPARNSTGFRVTFSDHAIEFVTSATGSDRDHVGVFLAGRGERIMSIELGIADLHRARAYLAGQGTPFTQWGSTSLVLSAGASLGAPIELTVRGDS
jgi:hypothetical protein